MYWPRAATAVLIAAHVWGMPSCGTPRVVIQPLNGQPDWVYGLADEASCAIRLRREKWALLKRDERCDLIVHEWGHLAGQQHSPDPKNVMYGGLPRWLYWRCWFPPLGGFSSQAWAALDVPPISIAPSGENEPYARPLD